MPLHETGLTKPQIITTLTQSPHAGGAGKRKKGEKLPKLTFEEKRTAQNARLTTAYGTVGLVAGREDAEFFAHLLAWNHVKGQVRDAKVALPILALATSKQPEFQENALAHLADLRPRELIRALEFGKSLPGVPKNLLRRLVERYLRDLEADYFAWERTAVQHRESLRTLYGRYRVKPGTPTMDRALMKDLPVAGKLEVIKRLKEMTGEQLAGVITQYKLPFLVLRGALGARLKEPEVLVAIIQRLSTQELITNMKLLDKLGVKTLPAARAALEAALSKAGSDKTAGRTVLKASRAAVVVEDEQLAGKLQALQEQQISNLKGIEGNWLVLADKSSSMSQSVDLGKGIAAFLARMVKGQVWLVFFDTQPRAFEVTGKTFEEITALTKHVTAQGNTSIGCGVQYCTDQKLQIDGIAVVSDGGDNTAPLFHNAYTRYVAAMGGEPTVYHYHVPGDSNKMKMNCTVAQIDVQEFSLGSAVDYASLPNLAQTMRVGRYSLLDEVYGTSLKTLDQVLDRTTGHAVIAQRALASAQ